MRLGVGTHNLAMSLLLLPLSLLFLPLISLFLPLLFPLHLLQVGTFNLIMSLLPPRITRLMEFVGFSGSRVGASFVLTYSWL